MASFKYIPDGKVLNEFFWDNSQVSIIQGPIGSGTSTACCMKIWRLACSQKKDRYGYRRSRWYIVRNTYNDLRETTIKTWTDWFVHVAEGAYGDVVMTNPPRHMIQTPLPDGSMLHLEVLFLALDQEEDKRKLLSAEPTGIWFNELQFTEKAIFDTAHSRAILGRFPPKRDGGPSWKGVIGDLNAPPEGHWLPYMRGDIPMPDEWDDDQRRQFVKPDDWKFLVQPPGLIEVIKDGRVVGYEENNHENRFKHGFKDLDAVAENQKWLSESYLQVIKGKPKSFVDTYVMNRVGMYTPGRPVFPSFRPEIHVAKEKIQFQAGLPLIVGIDFARNPAMIACQVIRGVLYGLGEMGVENMAATTYAPLFRQWLMKNFPQAFRADGAGIQFWGDPSGDSKGQGTDITPYMIFRSHGMNVVAAPGNNALSIRLNAIQSQLDKMVDGRAGMLIDPSCTVLKSGMAGGYQFGKVKGASRYHDAPEKNRYADYCDALQYAALGAGFGVSVLTGGTAAPHPVQIRKRKFSLRHR